MISIKQIKKLEEKVFKTVELIKALKQENKILNSEVESANKKVEELEQIISDYRSAQVEVEEGLANAIKQLDELDNISTSTIAVSGVVGKINKEEESSLFNNKSSLQNKEDQPDENEEEIEEIKINYSKISQNRPVSNATEKKSQNQSIQTVQNETEKKDNNQLDIF